MDSPGWRLHLAAIAGVIPMKLFGWDRTNSAEPSTPWYGRKSIYQHVLLHVPLSGPGLTEGGETLPDEEQATLGTSIRWAPGALDGVLSHHMGPGDEDELVEKAVSLLVAYCNEPTVAAKADVYRHVLEGNTLPVIDPIIRRLLSIDGLNHERLFKLAHWLVTEAPDREPVKFGIGILGLFRAPQNEAIFQTLGRHDEFTLYCAVALGNSADEPDEPLWTLARNVTGWGRIHVVERLAATEKPEIKAWLLREGFRNTVMHEYLAYTCATAGGLLSALSEDDVDRELLTAAGEILEALINGGPAENIDDYSDGALSVEMYLRHMDKDAATLGDFVHVDAVRRFLNTPDNTWESREVAGWTAQRRAELRALCDRILSRPEWGARATSELNSDDEIAFRQGAQVADAVGIDTWEHHWRRLESKPTDFGRWWHVMSKCDERRIDEAIAFAEQNLAAIEATPPFPGGFRSSAFDAILPALARFPGRGKALIEAGLRSSFVRDRNQAVATLAAWGRDAWSPSVEEALKKAAEQEEESEVQERMEQVLAGRPIEG